MSAKLPPRHRFGSYKDAGRTPENIQVPDPASAQAAYDEHMSHRVEAQSCYASKTASELRCKWVEKKFELKMALDMAKQASKVKWRTIIMEEKK